MRSMTADPAVVVALDAGTAAVDDLVKAVRAGDLHHADHDRLTSQLQAARALAARLEWFSLQVVREVDSRGSSLQVPGALARPAPAWAGSGRSMRRPRSAPGATQTSRLSRWVALVACARSAARGGSSPPRNASMVARDGDRCAAPYCDRPAIWSDAHHLQPWARGGATTIDNGALPCAAHHTMLHEGRWTLRRGDDGRHLMSHPDGRVIGPDPHPPGHSRPPPKP